MSFQRVETTCPLLSIRTKPQIQLCELRGFQFVHPPLGVLSDADEPAIAQRSQVLGDVRLAQTQSVYNRTSGKFILANKLDNPAPIDVRQGFKDIHAIYMLHWLYACQGI